MLIGTAGHIDHGKTTLVRALTGVDTDRLKEEKLRGISIELGYAYQAVPGQHGEVLGFVDVPGHERFIHTMLAGTSGIDFALLVVAADDGVMPQTVEHVEILDLLAIRRGAVAITKCDRVGAEQVAEVAAQVTRLLAPTHLADAAVFPLSAVKGEGVAALASHLYQAAVAGLAPPPPGFFRLAVDRAFTLSGIGTVVTGACHGGSLRVGDALVLSPSGRPVRVRGLHVQDEPAVEGHQGQRCAVALAGVGKEEIRRGDWLLAPQLHEPTWRFDLRLRLLGREVRSLLHWTPVHVHLGAAHRTGHVALLEGEHLLPGGEMFAQVVLTEPLGSMTGDICILRDAAATRTLGGGPVVDPFAPTRHRRSPQRLAALRALARPDTADALAGLLAASELGVDLNRFARARNLPDDHIPPIPAARAAGDWLFGDAHWQRMRADLLAALETFHQKNPDELGPQRDRLRRMCLPRHDAAVAEALVAELMAEGRVARSGPWIHLPTHAVRLSPAEEALAGRLRNAMAGMAEPLWVRDLAVSLGHDEGEVRKLMLRLMKRGELLQILRDLYVTPALAAHYAHIVGRLEAEGGGAPAARFRDVSGLGRKRAIQVLEFFDRVGYTRRAGESHCLRSGATPAMFDPC